MTHNDFTHLEINERAFAIFLMEGIQYFLEQDPVLQVRSIIIYAGRLWARWEQMNDQDKTPFWDRAVDDLRRLRRYRRADIYRSIMREDMPDVEAERRRQYRRPLD